MNTLNQVVFENAKWIFSGVGVPVLFFIVRYLLKSKTTARIAESNHAAHPNLLKPDILIDEAKKRPPLMVTAFSQQYEGLPVEWCLELLSAVEKNGNEAEFFFSAGRNGMVTCVFDLSKEPLIRAVSKGMRLNIKGIIKQVFDYRIDLRDASLSLPVETV